MAREIVKVPVENLRLDAENPRLDENLEAFSQADLMNVFYDNYVLNELAASYIANGFFPSEHLLALEDGTVLEGNRRLAALKFLLHDDDAREAGLPEYETDEEFTKADLDALKTVPVLYVDDREEVWAYLGFRHISGPKEWSPAAKARYVSGRVDEVAKSHPDDCFKIVGKEIGSNAAGARNMFIHYTILRAAREEYGLYKEAVHIFDKRFGVWERLLNNKIIYEYIGFDFENKSYLQIRNSLEGLDQVNLALLVHDLVPDEAGFVLLKDSRQATSYATIISNPTATTMLRETRDFESALLIAEGSSVNVRLRKISSLLDLVDSDLDNETPVDEETRAMVKRINTKLVGIKAKVDDALGQ